MQFSSNLECSKKAIRKVCPADAENAMVTVQDAVNDEIISQECFMLQADNKATGEDFSLSPLYPRCNSEQVWPILNLQFLYIALVGNLIQLFVGRQYLKPIQKFFLYFSASFCKKKLGGGQLPRL